MRIAALVAPLLQAKPDQLEFARATSVAEALSLVAAKPGSVWKAGGIDLLDRLKEHLIEPPGWWT